MVRRVLLGTAVGLGLLQGDVSAQSQGHWYAGVEGGVSNLSGDAIQLRDPAAGLPLLGALGLEPVFQFSTIVDSGWSANSRVGFHFSSLPVRGEVEVGFRFNDIPGESFSPQANIDPETVGSFEQISVMANALYDFKLIGDLSGVAGFGIGVSHLGLNLGTRDADEWVLAWQGIVGVEWNLGANVHAGVTYRNFNTAESAKFRLGNSNVDVSFGETMQHSVSVGLRFDLN